MILRILRGRAGDQELSRILDDVRTDVDEWSAIPAGMVYAQPAFRASPDGVEFLLVSNWIDAESVLARGGEVTLPRGRLGANGNLRDGRAQHFELMLRASVEDRPPGEVLRLSSVGLVPRRSRAFYERVRQLWDELVGDAGLVSMHVGRRVEPLGEQAVVVTVWETAAALEAATAGGFVGGDEMHAFYEAEPTIEHFTAMTLDRGDGRTTGS